jgi:hypothetical protein
MKIFISTLTVLIHIFCVLCSKFLDDFLILISIFICTLIIGLVILFLTPKTSSLTRNIGWGLLYGSLTSIVSSGVFLLWFGYALSH